MILEPGIYLPRLAHYGIARRQYADLSIGFRALAAPGSLDHFTDFSEFLLREEPSSI